MEYVRGEPVTAYCDRHRLTTRERLELFLLVATQDDRAAPKIIDFGVSKAISQPLTDRTLHTVFGGFVGTLEYLSPEQAESGGADVDTRADVISTGSR
jgi:non-specific serine/threonine protein kinase/serine/threonine-protein kinase